MWPSVKRVMLRRQNVIRPYVVNHETARRVCPAAKPDSKHVSGVAPRRMRMHLPTSFVLVASWLARSPPDDKNGRLTSAPRAGSAGLELGPARVRPGASSARREVGQARVFQPAEEAKPRESARAAGCEFGWARSRPGANCSAPGGGRAGGECMSRWVPVRRGASSAGCEFGQVRIRLGSNSSGWQVNRMRMYEVPETLTPKRPNIRMS